MRKFILKSVTVLGLAAICIALTGSASAETAHTGGASANRAHRILVAKYGQTVLV